MVANVVDIFVRLCYNDSYNEHSTIKCNIDDTVMTMHLLRGASSLNTRKPKPKLTKSKMQELEHAWRKHNKEMKQKGCHDLRFSSLDDYVDYCFGKVKLKKEFKQYAPSPSAKYRETPNYPSASISSSGAEALASATARKEPQRYTGTLIKGISTMHKSNAVPIIDEREAKEHASMRR